LPRNIQIRKEFLSDTLSSIGDGVIVADRQGTVLFINPSGERMTGWSEKSAAGKPFGEIFSLVDYSTGRRLSDPVRPALEQGRTVGLQNRSALITREGKTLFVSASCSPVRNAAGEVEGAVVVFRDIDRIKNLEEAVRREKNNLESANRAKSEFLANMSHEIRTPLNGMMGMLDLLLMSDPGEEQREYVRMAKLSAESLLKVINDILDFSRIEAGKVSITDALFDIKTLTTELVKINTVLAEKKGLHLQYYFAPGIPRFVIGDPDRLSQILNNLVGNAIKFTNQGQIRVEVRKTGGTKQKVELEYRVSDTGIGISAVKMSQLFKRFSQVDGSLTRRYSGAGLGLAISRELAEMMGGSIRAESEIGRGSTFCLSVGFLIGKTPSAAARRFPAPETGQSASMILTDGDDLNRLISEKTIRRPDAGTARENGGGAGKCRHVRLGEDGEIILNGGGKPAAGGDASAELPELGRALHELGRILQESSFSMIEETAHRIKKIALRADLDDLADLAFKTELAARKYNWDQATEYCREILRRQQRRPG
jgi:PAS domain S-box-containing protein